MAITTFKTPDGGEYEGLVAWLDVGDQRIKFVLPYDPYPTIFDTVVHYGSGRNICEMPINHPGSRRDRAKAAITRAVAKYGVKHVLKVLTEAPVINAGVVQR